MKTLKILVVVFVAGVAFAAGAVTSLIRGWGDRSVVVEVANKSSQTIQSFTVRYDTCGNKGEIRSGELLPGKSQTIRFSVCGEGGYIVEAAFVGGSTVKGGGGYVESGYSTIETITAQGIASAQRGYAL